MAGSQTNKKIDNYYYRNWCVIITDWDAVKDLKVINYNFMVSLVIPFQLITGEQILIQLP